MVPMAPSWFRWVRPRGVRRWRGAAVVVGVLGASAWTFGASWLAEAKPKVSRSQQSVVSYPTFQLEADGRTTLALRVSKAPEVEESTQKGHYFLRIKNARILVRNDAHVLHAEHFDSAVLEARLKSAGNDVLFDVTLRTAVTPTRSVRAVTDAERAEEPHKDLASSAVVVTLEFPRVAPTPEP